jgi:hypothetical protein
VAEIGQFLRRIWSLEGGNTSSDPSPFAEGCEGIRDALTKLEVALCTGILPSGPNATDATAPVRSARLRQSDCSGRVCYLAPGQPEPDPRKWQFRKVSKKVAAFMSGTVHLVRDRIRWAKVRRSYDYHHFQLCREREASRRSSHQPGSAQVLPGEALHATGSAPLAPEGENPNCLIANTASRLTRSTPSRLPRTSVPMPFCCVGSRSTCGAIGGWWPSGWKRSSELSCPSWITNAPNRFPSTNSPRNETESPRRRKCRGCFERRSSKQDAGPCGRKCRFMACPQCAGSAAHPSSVPWQ